jgi:hypothetical protein
MATEEIIFEESVDNAEVSWENDTVLKVSVTPGTVQTERSVEYGYFYDLITRQKRPLR